MKSTGIMRVLVPLAMVLASIALAVLVILGVDRAAGHWIQDPRLTAGLIFPPQVEIALKTYEYTYTIKTNALGLRDEEFDLRHRPRVLVATIGDSYTFGQGVELQDTWVQRVEKNLRGKNLDVEILNLGQPGGSPQTYAALAEETLPLLKPDLTLVNLLQMDDLMQTTPGQTPQAPAFRRDPPMRTFLRAWFPNLADLAYREHAQQLAEREKRSEGRWSVMNVRWKSDFDRAYKTFKKPARDAFAGLPQNIQDAFRNGELNPVLSLMVFTKSQQSLWQRERDQETDSPEMQARIDIAADCLRRIQRTVSPWGGHVIVLSIPSMIDNDPFGTKVWRDVLGSTYVLRPGDTRVDDAIRQTAGRADLPCHDVTAAFRDAAAKEPLFYPLDTHMNARGNEVYASLIAPVIEQSVREIASR